MLFVGFREHIQQIITDNYDILLERAEQELDINIQYRSLAVRTINMVHIQDVTVQWRGNLIFAEHITARVNPFRVRQGTPLASIRSIHLHKLDIRLSIDALTELNREITAHENILDTGIDSRYVQELADTLNNTRISITRTSVITNNRDTQYIAHDVNLSLSLSERILTYQGTFVLHTRALSTPIPFLVQETGSQAHINIAGNYDIALSRAISRMRLEHINVGGVRLHPMEFDVRYHNGHITVANNAEFHDLHIACTYNIRTQVLHINAASDGLIYDQLILESRSTVRVPHFLQNEYALSLNLKYRVMHSELDYRLKIDVIRQQSTLIHIDVEGDNTNLTIVEAAWYSAAGSMQIDGDIDLARRTMQGSVLFDYFTIMNSRPVNGILHISTTENEGVTSVVGSNVELGAISIPTVTANMYLLPSAHRLNITMMLDSQQTQIASLIINSTPATGAAEYVFSLLNVEAQKIFDIGNNIVPHTIPQVGFINLEDLQLNAQISTQNTAQNITVNIPFFNITHRPTSRELFSFQGGGDEEKVTIDQIIVHLFDTKITGHALVHSATSQSYNADLVFNSQEEHYNVSIRYRRRQFMHISSSHGLSAVVLFLPNNQLRYTMQLDSFPVQVGEHDFVFNLASQGRYESAQAWNITIPTLSLIETTASQQRRAQNFYRSVLPYQFSAAVDATSHRILFNEIVMQDHISAFDGDGTLVINSNAAQLALTLNADASSEHIHIDGHFPLDSITESILSVDMRGIQLAHIPINAETNPQLAVLGNIDCTVLMRINAGQAHTTVSFSSNDAYIGNYPFSAQGVASINPEHILIDIIDIQYVGYRIQDSSVIYERTEYHATASILLVQEERISIIASAPTVITESPYPLIETHITMEAMLSEPTGASIPQLESAYLLLSPEDDLSDRAWRFQIQREPSNARYVLSTGENNELVGYINNDNSFNFLATRAFPVSFSAQGRITNGNIDMFVADIFVDTQRIPRLADAGFIRFTTGEYEGTVYITGSTSNPEFYGKITGTNLYIHNIYVAEEIGPIDAFMILQEHEWRIPRFFANIDEDAGAYFASVFEFDHLILTNFAINIDTPPNKTVPFQYDFDTLYINTAISGHVALYGTDQTVRIEGDIVGESGQVIATQSVSTDDGAEVTENTSVVLDIDIKTGPKMELLWPAEQFPILRVFPEQNLPLTVRTDSQGTVLLAGDIILRGGEVFYFERNFLIKEGAILLSTNTRTENAFDPIIRLRAEIREYRQSGPTTIFLIVEQDFLSQLSPRLEASPALSPAEIAVILGENIIQSTVNNGEDNARSAVNVAGDVLSRIVILNDFERSLKKVLGVFDILTIRTQLLQNVIYDILDTSNATSSQNIARYFNNTNLFLGRYLADKLFFQFEIGLRADEQSEYYGGALADLDLDVSLSFEFQSPLGALSWGITPQFEEQLRIENTVSLVWSMGY